MVESSLLKFKRIKERMKQKGILPSKKDVSKEKKEYSEMKTEKVTTNEVSQEEEGVRSKTIFRSKYETTQV